MKYNRLPYLTNTYPQTGNYITTGENISTLYGIYADVNKVDFNLPDIKQIKVIADTKFRSVIGIYKNKNDKSPKYYTSEIYSRDLEASKIESNPYLIEYSVKDSAIIKVYLEDIVQNIKAFREQELKLGVEFIRNNFILYNNSGLYTNEPKDTTAESNQLNFESNALNTKIQKFETALLTVESDAQLKRGLFYGPNKRKAVIEVDGERFESPSNLWNDTRKQIEYLKEKVTQRVSELKAQKQELDKKVETNIKNSYSLVDRKSILINPNAIESDIQKVLKDVIAADDFDDIISINDVFVDCKYLIKFIDWILSTPTLEEIENNGVIKAEELSVFKTSTGTLQSNSTGNIETTPNNNQKKYYTYRIIRLSIPATFEQSRMTFKDISGQTQIVQTDKYGLVGEYCVEENSWNENTNVYQRMQLAECYPNNSKPDVGSGYMGGGRPRMGGNPDMFNEINSNMNYIDYNRDNRPIE